MNSYYTDTNKPIGNIGNKLVKSSLNIKSPQIAVKGDRGMADYENDLNLRGLTRINFYDSLFSTDREKEEFIEECRGMDSFRIRSYAGKIRKRKIEERSYSSDQFTKKYEDDKSAALSELFMEPISPNKAEELPLKNPHEIYQIHSKCSKDIYFVKFLNVAR